MQLDVQSDTTPGHIHKPHPRAKRGPDQSKLFHHVISLYLAGKERLSGNPLAASNCDPDAHRSLNPFILAEFLYDVELAIEATCKDDIGMQESVISLLREMAGLPECNLSAGRKADLIDRCGIEFDRRKLSPKRYFWRTKVRVAR
jgi:hypothetical protein